MTKKMTAATTSPKIRGRAHEYLVVYIAALVTLELLFIVVELFKLL